ncbi:MAG: BrnT family toxin [Ignavibacteria bacterium]
MDNFDNITGFDWDKHNSEKIYQKHKITINEAESVFADSKFVLSGARISGNETRHAIMGTSGKKKLIAIFTIRKNKIRIISARPQSRKERKIYEEESKNK